MSQGQKQSREHALFDRFTKQRSATTGELDIRVHEVLKLSVFQVTAAHPLRINSRFNRQRAFFNHGGIIHVGRSHAHEELKQLDERLMIVDVELLQLEEKIAVDLEDLAKVLHHLSHLFRID